MSVRDPEAGVYGVITLPEVTTADKLLGHAYNTVRGTVEVGAHVVEKLGVGALAHITAHADAITLSVPGQLQGILPEQITLRNN